MTENDHSKIDRLLDLLLDALQEREAARRAEGPGAPAPPPIEEAPEDEPPEPVPAPLAPAGRDEPSDVDRGPDRETGGEVEPPVMQEAEREAVDEVDGAVMAAPDAPEKPPTIHLDRMLGRLVVVLLVIIVLINIPFNRYGTNLARAMPDRQALVIRDGLLLKGDGDEVYVLEDNHKRWISSLEAFEYYGYRWDEVNQVDDDFLAQFPDGPPLSILYKCEGSPHVYAIEDGMKRWIEDIPTFEAEGYVWDDVQIVPCGKLRGIPDGLPIPPDAGEPPPPLP
jgi:hypothetical protein